MNISRLFSRQFLTAIIAILSFTANALELPTKKINGKEYYYYKVLPQETIYSISHKLGISKNNIEKFNPSAIDGLMAHDTLYFPVSEFPATSTSETVSITQHIKHKVKKGETIYGISRRYNVSTSSIIALNPSAKDGIKNGEILLIPDYHSKGESIKATTHESEDPKTGPIAISDNIPIEITNDSCQETTDTATIKQNTHKINIAVMLPFMLDRKTPNKQALLFTEFYKGMLIGVNEMKDSIDINIHAYDTADSLGLVQSILNKKNAIDSADIIIGPNDKEQLNAISQYASEKGSYVLNIFDVKNNLYTKNNSILQALTPQERLQEKAIDFFVSNYRTHTPVFLKNLERVSDKALFVNNLKERLDAEKITYKEINYNDILTDENISRLDSTMNYVFVPTSASRADLSNIIGTIHKFNRSCPNPESAKLFGYPEWTTFQGNIIKKLHDLNTVIYSRFYHDKCNSKSDTFISEFIKWYGHEMLSTTPLQGLLGYDTVMYLINSTLSSDGIFRAQNNYSGVQNCFNLIQDTPDSGYYNNIIFLIEFKHTGETTHYTR